MTKDITRFVDDENSTALRSFIDLFGDAEYREAWRGLEGIGREDAIVAAYCDRIRRAGSFKHCAATVILNAKRDRTHYHLVYATRSLQGLIAFRETERRAVPEQRDIRADVKQRDRVAHCGQSELFPAPVMDSSYVSALQDRYQDKARTGVIALLHEHQEVEYDSLVATALHHPMTSLHELKRWIAAWRDSGAVDLLGLTGGGRTPTAGKSHRVRLRTPRLLE